jgi:small subunit ribosomal protein S20
MPVIKSAKKKLKVDRKRESANKKARVLANILIKKARKKPTEKSILEAFRAIDKGVKRDIFHKNKGARIKSALSKLINKKSPGVIGVKKTKK